MKKKKGFTLLEMILAMLLFSWVLVIFASMVSFNFRFSSMTFRTDDTIQDYVSKNTYIYNQVYKSTEIVELSGSRVLLTVEEEGTEIDKLLEIKDNKLYYETEVLYVLRGGSYIVSEDDKLVIYLELDNALEQNVEIVVPYIF